MNGAPTPSPRPWLSSRLPAPLNCMCDNILPDPPSGPLSPLIPIDTDPHPAPQRSGLPSCVVPLCRQATSPGHAEDWGVEEGEGRRRDRARMWGTERMIEGYRDEGKMRAGRQRARSHGDSQTDRGVPWGWKGHVTRRRGVRG
eukprot:766476-Hanusia_phi.AAC.1